MKRIKRISDKLTYSSSDMLDICINFSYFSNYFYYSPRHCFNGYSKVYFICG